MINSKSASDVGSRGVTESRLYHPGYFSRDWFARKVFQGFANQHLSRLKDQPHLRSHDRSATHTKTIGLLASFY